MVCVIIRVDGGAIGVQGFQQHASYEGGTRTRGGVYVGQESRTRVAGLPLPLCLLFPTTFSANHTYIQVRGLWKLSMVEQRFVLILEGSEI